MRRRRLILLILVAGIATPLAVRWSRPRPAQAEEAPAPRPAGGHAALADAAFKETRRKVTYDPAYVKIPYPGGDVPADRGVCADVVIRAFRRIGIDLQKEGRGLLHIGIVSDRKGADGKRRQVVHNIGGGQVLEDALFDWKVIGHYRWPSAP